MGKGGFEGWSLPSNWKHLNGMLISDGTGSGAQGKFIPTYAPYVPTTADYAVEAQVQAMQTPGFGGLGPVVRATVDNKEGYVAKVGKWGLYWTASNICYLDSGECKVPGQPYDAGTDWHTYRLEAKANTITFLIDGSLSTILPDNLYLKPGRVGFVTVGGEQVQMRNFKVLKLQ